MHHFIFMLGSEFKTIQNNFHIGNLPSEWHTQDWPTLLILCWDYFHSINPYGILKWDHSNNGTSSVINPADHAAQHKKVKQWFLNPAKFCCELESEQKKYPGKCIYHLSKPHSTGDCSVKKECDTLLLEKRDATASNLLSGTSGRLRNIKEEVFEDAVADDSITEDSVDTLIESTNDTNEDALYYFAHMTNQYLRLVKASPFSLVASLDIV
jgi:hypothetical protein